VSDLKGFGFQVGGSIGEGISVGGDYLFGIGPNGMTYQGGQISIAATLGLLFDFDIHALATFAAGWDSDTGW